MNAIHQRSQFRKDYRSYKMGNESLYVQLLQSATYMLAELGYTIDLIDGVYVLNHNDRVIASGVSGDYILELTCNETFKYLEQDIDFLLTEQQSHQCVSVQPGINPEDLMIAITDILARRN
jgi:hypothetical protein